MSDNSSESLDRQLGAYQSMISRHASQSADGPVESLTGWMKFAAATGASLAGATSVDAAITHVVPPAPIRVVADNNQGQVIDLDNDLQNDLRIGAGKSGGPVGTNFWSGTAQGLYDAALIGDYGFGSSGSTLFAVRQFADGAEIPAVQPSLFGSFLRASTTAFGIPYGAIGNWGVAEVGIAGVILDINSQPRVGWVKIRTESLSGRLRAISVLEWAFQTVPGASIKAGQTSGPLLGDYNNNGSVGPEDYTVWKNTFNSNLTAGTGADGNSNGKVDAADFTVWRDRQTVFGSASAAAVPEPTAVSLGVLALGAAGVAALRRRAAQ